VICRTYLGVTETAIKSKVPYPPTACKASPGRVYAPWPTNTLQARLQNFAHRSNITTSSFSRSVAMAATSFRLGLACFVLLVAAAGATEYKVGGGNGWAVPDANAEPFNTWAEKTSFQIGDKLCKCLLLHILPPLCAAICR
jgi:hypothetical protein